MRLFAAFELNDETRAFVQSAADLLADSGVDGRFEAASKFHVTLAFLGPTAPERLGRVLAALTTACRSCRPFDLGFETIGAFPNERRARIVWVGPRRTPAGFVRCADAVFSALTNAGWELERKPQPHVTICRLKNRTPIQLPHLRKHARQRIAAITLFQSLPAGPTTRYVQLERLPFGPQADPVQP